MQNILLIFIVIFALGIGFFLGIFLLSLDTPLTKKFSKKGSPEDSDSPVVQTESVEGSISTEGQKKPSPDSQLILQVWKEEGKPPVYDMAGKYLPKEDIPREILNVITVHDEKSPAMETQTMPVLKDIPPIAEEEDEVDTEVKMLSVIEEVNDILQKKLTGSPMAGKGIHLMENHNNEIRFWVGLNSYDDVEEIPDPEVRQFIDAAVKEWEKNRE